MPMVADADKKKIMNVVRKTHNEKRKINLRERDTNV